MVSMHQFSYKPVSGNWLLKCGILFIFRFVSEYSAFICVLSQRRIFILHASCFKFKQDILNKL